MIMPVPHDSNLCMYLLAQHADQVETIHAYAAVELDLCRH